MEPTPNRRLWTRRRMLAAAVLTCSGALTVSWMWKRCDPQLLGTWLVTNDKRPTADQIERATDPNGLSGHYEWTFHGNGTGTEFNMFMYGTGNFRWWTEGDRVFIRHGAGAKGWEWVRMKSSELYDALHGHQSRYATGEYVFAGEDAATIRLTAQHRPRRADVVFLTRLDKE
jgi:hypothetical protein